MRITMLRIRGHIPGQACDTQGIHMRIRTLPIRVSSVGWSVTLVPNTMIWSSNKGVEERDRGYDGPVHFVNILVCPLVEE